MFIVNINLLFFWWVVLSHPLIRHVFFRHTHSVKIARETIEMTTGVMTHRYKLLKCDQGKMCGDEKGCACAQLQL